MLKIETGGNLGICRGSHIDWRNAFEAFSSTLWVHFISRGQLLITHCLGDGRTDVGKLNRVGRQASSEASAAELKWCQQ